MEKRRPKTWLLISFIAVVPLLAINWRQVERRQVDDGINQDLINPDMPPSLLLTTQAVGPFRGLISNALWWRAIRLQDDGQHFEARQLSNWISSLQPKIPAVWEWQAWNMSFNISAAYDEPEEKYKWIMAGVDLLREKGLRYNPGDLLISNQIAEILWTKMRNDHYNQWQWSNEMGRYLKVGDRAELAMLQESAADESALRTLEGVSAFLNQCASAGLTVPEVVAILLEERGKDTIPTMVQPLFDDADTASAREQVRRYGARDRLTNTHKLDLDRAYIVDDKYGPFDWRTFHSHVVYWGTTNKEEDESFRSVRQAMTDAFYSGKLMYADEKGATFVANLYLAKNIHHYVVAHADAYPGDKGAQALSKEFHERAVILLYTEMYEEEAKEMFEDYKFHLMSDKEKRRWTFESFLTTKAKDLYENMSVNKGRTIIYSTLGKAYFWASLGDAYRAKGYERLAMMLWKRAKKDAKGKRTLNLDPFPQIRKDVLAMAIGPNSAYPKETVDRLRAMAKGQDVLNLVDPAKRPKIDIGAHAHEK